MGWRGGTSHDKRFANYAPWSIMSKLDRQISKLLKSSIIIIIPGTAMGSIKAPMEELIRYFLIQPHVIVAYLFGSVSRSGATRLSDLDLAVYLDNDLSKQERFEARLRFISELSTILRTNSIDLIVMNDASIMLNFEVIKANTPIVVKDHDRRVEIEHYIMSRYLDRKYYETQRNELLLQELRAG